MPPSLHAPFLAACLALAIPAQAADRADAIADPDTQAWWRATAVLASDAMEGRDIGSPGHERAGRWVADQFRAAGLKPAGDSAGIAAAYAPVAIGRLRELTRTHPHLTFAELRRIDPRRARPSRDVLVLERLVEA